MKANFILVVVLLLLATIYFATEKESKIPQLATDAMNPLLKDFDEDLVTRIRISDGDKEVNILKKTTIVEQNLPSNFPGEWLIVNANYHPAKTDDVSLLLSNLLRLKKGFKTSDDDNLTSNDVSNYYKFGVDEDNALKIELFKQVSNLNEDKLNISEVPYFALMVGKSSETDEFRGINERFMRLGTYDESKSTSDENVTPMFTYNDEIRRVKKVNVDLMSPEIDRWINLDIFKLKDVLNNVDDFECINIINNDDLSNSFYLARTDKETFDENGNEIKENNWNFYEDPISALKLESYKPVDKAKDNSVRDFLYEVKSFRAKGFKGLKRFNMTLEGELTSVGRLNARLIVKGELHKYISESVMKELKDLDENIIRLKSQFFATPENDVDARRQIFSVINEKFIDKLQREESRILKFYIYEENKDIRTAEELKKTIEESGKSVDDIANTLKLSKTLLQNMMDGVSEINEDIIDRIRSEYPFMFHNYWMILTTSRFEDGNEFIHWQYSISHDQVTKLAPEKSKFEMPKPEEPVDENTDTPENPEDDDVTDENDQQTKPDSVGKAEIIEAPELPQVKITTNYGDIIVELFEDDAPNAVANFISLCEKGFYNDIRFHRIDKDTKIHVGCPYARNEVTKLAGTGDAGYFFSDEIIENKRKADKPGILLMDNAINEHIDRDTNSSRFIVTIKELPGYETGHTVFGQIIEGLDVAKKISNVEIVNRVDLGLLRSPMKDVYIIKTEVLKKRDHEYKVKTIEEEE